MPISCDILSKDNMYCFLPISTCSIAYPAVYFDSADAKDILNHFMCQRAVVDVGFLRTLIQRWRALRCPVQRAEQIQRRHIRRLPWLIWLVQFHNGGYYLSYYASGKTGMIMKLYNQLRKIVQCRIWIQTCRYRTNRFDFVCFFTSHVQYHKQQIHM